MEETMKIIQTILAAFCGALFMSTMPAETQSALSNFIAILIIVAIIAMMSLSELK